MFYVKAMNYLQNGLFGIVMDLWGESNNVPLPFCIQAQLLLEIVFRVLGFNYCSLTLYLHI